MAVRWVFAMLERDWGIVGRAGQVELSPFTLDVRVRDLTLSAVGADEQPFLTAEAVTVELPWSAVFGTPAIDLLEVVGPVLSVRQTADGTSNLPVLPPGEPSSDRPGKSLRLGVVAVHRASASWVDEARGLRVMVGSGPSWSCAQQTRGRRPPASEDGAASLPEAFLAAPQRGG